MRARRLPNSNFKQPGVRVPAPPREVGFWFFSPRTMRGAGRRKAHCNRPRLIFRIAGRQRHTATPLGVPPRRLLRPWDRFFRARARVSSPSRWLSPPFTRLVQPLKAAPRSGHGRLPKAPRVHASEAWPRAPHPTGLGYPAPAKLSLCPTSGSPLEAPLTGQDTSRISEV